MIKYIVIPAHNEEKTVERIVRSSKRYGRVIVVDDASTDDTADIAEWAGATVIKHNYNEGYGKTLHDGMLLAIANGADFIITLDADGQHMPEEIPRLIRELRRGYDVVVGSRFGRRQWGTWRRSLALRMLALEMRALTGLNLSDVQSGFRGYRADVLKAVECGDFGMGFSVELPIKAHKRGFIFKETGITIKKPARIKSFSSVMRQGIQIGLAILKYAVIG